MSRLSYKLKKEINPIVLERDGYKCLYNNCEFTETNPLEYDHLNNNPQDNRPENLAFCCHTCNNKKKFSPEMQVIAHEKMIENERTVLMRAGMLADTGTTEQLTTSQAINKTNRRLALQWITEHTITEPEIIVKDAVNAIVNLCQDSNDTGSQSAVYRYIDEFTNPYNGKFTLCSNPQGKTIIRRRSEN